MKIVHCVYEMEIGGIQVLLVDLLNELCKTSDTSLVILNNQADESLMNRLSSKVKVHCLQRRKGSRNPAPLLRLNILLLKLDPDIVHCHDISMIRVIRLKNFKVMLTIHDVHLPLLYFHRYDYLVAISNAVYMDVRSRGNYEMTTVNNGVPDDVFKQRNQYHPDENEALKLVQVSRLDHEKKGQDILLHALAELVHKSRISGISLHFAGGGDSLSYLKGLAAALKLHDHVSFIGEKSRDWLFNNLSGYHALIQPSRYEGFGLTVVEGLKAGLPVIASDNYGPARILTGNPAGFLFENGNSASCARQILHVFDLYKTGRMAQIMKASALQKNHDYSMAACSSGYVKVYKEITGGGLPAQ